MRFTDSHAHVYLEQFEKDLPEIIRRSQEFGVDRIFMPNIDSETTDEMLEVELAYPETCIPMMGLHPCSVKKHFEKELYLVEEWLQRRSFAAVGEIGTDLFWDKTTWPQQQEALKIQLQWGIDYQLPVVLHSRDSIDETIDIVRPYAENGLKGVFHCFTGTKEQARKITEMGFVLGIGGVSTFKNGGLDKVLDKISLEKLILETDSPYLAPVPHRGKRNEPSYIPLIAARVSEISGEPVEKVAELTTTNTLNLFHEIREN